MAKQSCVCAYADASFQLPKYKYSIWKKFLKHEKYFFFFFYFYILSSQMELTDISKPTLWAKEKIWETSA